MARIRSIKPEYWTDEKIVELTIPARLLFIGSWNVADDQGYLEPSAKQLKLRVMPSDKVSAEKLVRELFDHGLLREVDDADGKRWWHIINWERHQKPQHPSTPRVIDPNPVFAGDSQILMSPHESSPPIRSGEERRGVEGSGEESSIGAEDFDQIYDAWIREKALTQHKRPTTAMRRQAKKALADHDLADILQAVSLYATILVSQKHYYSHRWTLDDFLARGVDKFTPDTDPLTRFFGAGPNGNGSSSGVDRDPAAAHQRDLAQCRSIYQAELERGASKTEARSEAAGFYKEDIVIEAIGAA